MHGGLGEELGGAQDCGDQVKQVHNQLWDDYMDKEIKPAKTYYDFHSHFFVCICSVYIGVQVDLFYGGALGEQGEAG